MAVDIRNGPLDRAWLAVSRAETGSYPDPNIRTTARDTPGGSSAFGPVQLTYNTAKDYADRKKLTPETMKFFQGTMEPMYQKMLLYGNEKGLTQDQAKYDYGGNAGYDPVQSGDGYEALTKEIMADMWTRSNGDIMKFIQMWRGVPQAQDPRYYEEALKQYGAR